MRKQMHIWLKRLLIATLLLAMVASFAGCKQQEELPPEAEGRKVIYFAASYVSAQMQDAYREMVKVYNESQGVTDGVYVQMRESAGALAGLESALRNNYQYDVIQLNDDEFKSLAMQGGNLFIPLDKYMTDDVKAAMQWNDIAETAINRFRMDQAPSEGGKYMAGAGASLLALPIYNNPHIMYYNKSSLEKSGINIVSVPEAELESYNAANNATLMPHGYAEYKEAPFATAKSSRNEAGEYVYKIFNPCIPMSWEEQRLLSRAFLQYGFEYGYLSEWWFNYGFSVGGDCVGWDEASGNYKLTLCDKQPGYLALADITVDGVNYAKGEVLNYEAKAYLNNNASALQALEGKVYALPSQYDAILEFTRMAVPTDKQADTGIYGYGVSPTTTNNRSTKFTAGEVPLYIESYSEALSFKNVLGEAMGMALPAQYREYAGGSTYTKNGKEYLKVIGETYDGEVYTGQLHIENGTAVMGEAMTDSECAGLFLPTNTKNKNYDEAFKFASWVASPDAQKILSKGNKYVPIHNSYAMGEYAASADRLVSDTWIGGYACQKSEIGDYTYFTSLTWITEWSLTFNSTVREGNMTISDFIAQKQEAGDLSLRGMRLRINGR